MIIMLTIRSKQLVLIFAYPLIPKWVGENLNQRKMCQKQTEKWTEY